MGALSKLIRNPSRYLPILPRMALQPLCRIFQNRSFFLQGQMDIHSKSRWRSDLTAQTGGFSPPGEAREVCNLDPHDNTRRDMIALLLRMVMDRGVPGDFAEVGVYKGLTARLIHHYAPERALHLFDTFEGFTEQGLAGESRATGLKVSPKLFANTSLDRVRAFVNPVNATVFFYRGYFPQSIPRTLHERTFAFVHLDADLYAPILEGLRFFYPRVPRGGVILVHDYNSWPGARRAVDEFFAGKPETPLPMPDKSGSAVVVKL